MVLELPHFEEGKCVYISTKDMSYFTVNAETFEIAVFYKEFGRPSIKFKVGGDSEDFESVIVTLKEALETGTGEIRFENQKGL